jgi:hypothetical protein
MNVFAKSVHPQVNSDRKPEPSYYPALAAFDIKVDSVAVG